MSIYTQQRIVFRLSISLVLVLLAEPGLTGAESGWPHWRGPTGNGISPDGRPPVEWGESKNVKWKVEIPGRGSASPVVLGDKVFVATAIQVGGGSSRGVDAGQAGRRAGRQRGLGGQRGAGRPARGGGRGGGPPDTPQQFVLLCLDRTTGRTLWSRTAAEVTPHEGHQSSHGFASASPFIDAERVYAYFGSRGLFCYDFRGELVWEKTDFGKMRTRSGYGEGSSATIHGDTIVVPWDHEGPSYLIAINKNNGQTIWKADRDEPTCWATPLVIEQGGATQVVASGQNFVRGYDLATGEELWRCGGQTTRPVASPVSGHGLVFVGSGFRGAFLGAFRLDRQGNLEDTDGVAWTMTRNTPDVPSLLLSGRRLYFLAGRSGVLSCVDALSKRAYFSTERVEGISDVYASPVAANGKIYLTSRDGTIVVIEDADQLRIVATNQLDEGVDATPAIAGQEIFVRGSRHLYCFAAE